MNAFLIALQFLTRLPVKVAQYPEQDLKSALYWYGAVGLVIGSILYLVIGLLTLLAPSLDSGVLAAIILSVWVLLTGALHLDGLADSADAWLGGTSKEKALLIMKDPQSGPAGVTAIVLVLLTKYACLQAIVQTHTAAIVLIPALARSFAPLLFQQTTYVREQGLGQHFSDGLSAPTALIGFALIFFIGLVLIGANIIIPLALAGVMYYVLRILMIKHIGGTTGDTAGGMIEILEMALLFGFACIY